MFRVFIRQDTGDDIHEGEGWNGKRSLTLCFLPPSHSQPHSEGKNGRERERKGEKGRERERKGEKKRERERERERNEIKEARGKTWKT